VTLMDVFLTVDCLSPYIRQWCRQGGTLGSRR